MIGQCQAYKKTGQFIRSQIYHEMTTELDKMHREKKELENVNLSLKVSQASSCKDESIKQLKAELNRVNQKYQNVRGAAGELLKIKASHKEILKRLDESHSTKMQHCLLKAENELKELKEQQHEELMVVSRQNIDYEKQIENLKQENTEYKEKISLMEEMIREMREKIETLQTRNDQMKTLFNSF